MFQLKRNCTWNFFLRHCSLSIIIVNLIATLLITILYYYAAPFLMNFSPNFNNIKKYYTIDFRVQIAAAVTSILILTSTVLWYVLRSIDKWHVLLKLNNDESGKKLEQIRGKCMNAPYYIFMLQIGITFIPVLLYGFNYVSIFGKPLVNFIKVLLLSFSSAVLLAVITFIFSKSIYTRILINTYNENDVQGKRIPLRYKIIILLFPLFISIVSISSIAVYSSIIGQRGHFIFREYRMQLEKGFSKVDMPTSPEQLLKELSPLNVSHSKICNFVISPDGRVYTSDGSKLDPDFFRYMKTVSGENFSRIYGSYSELNGAIIKIKGLNGDWIAGVSYSIASDKIISGIHIAFFVLVLTGVLIAFYFIKAFTIDISLTGKFIKNLANGTNQPSQKIPITSNDEISDLIVVFNKIRAQDFEYDKLKTEFLANISHELRTPLSVLLGTIQLIDINTDNKTSFDQKKMKNNINTMRQNCYRLLRLVNNFIDATSIDAGSFKPQLKNCNIVSVVEETVLSIVNYAEKQGLELCFDTETEEKIMALDRYLIERIMLNLLSNAIKFAGKGSIIKVQICDRPEHVIISIKDNGAGIPSDKHALIFERFTHVDGLLTRKREGAGMGLFLVRSFVELLGGVITIKSEEQKGCEFLITLPVSQVDGEEISACDEKDLYENSSEKASIEFSDIL